MNSNDLLSPDCLAFSAHTSGVALRDDALSDDPLSDDALSDDALSGDALSGDALSDDALSDDALWLDSLLACTVDADVTSSRCKSTKADMLSFYSN